MKASDLMTTTFSNTSLLLYSWVKRVKRLLVSRISDKPLLVIERSAYMNRSNPRSLYEVEVLECTPSCAMYIRYKMVQMLSICRSLKFPMSRSDPCLCLISAIPAKGVFY